MRIDDFVRALPPCKRECYDKIVGCVSDYTSEMNIELRDGCPWITVAGVDFMRMLVARDWINIYLFNGSKSESRLFVDQDSSEPGMCTVRAERGKGFDMDAFAELIRDQVRVAHSKLLEERW